MPRCEWQKIYHLLILITITSKPFTASPLAVRQNIAAMDCERRMGPYTVVFTLYFNVMYLYRIYRSNHCGNITSVEQGDAAFPCIYTCFFQFHCLSFKHHGHTHPHTHTQTADKAESAVMSEHFPINIGSSYFIPTLTH